MKTIVAASEPEKYEQVATVFKALQAKFIWLVVKRLS